MTGMSARTEVVEIKRGPSQDDSQQMQLVQALSSLGEVSELTTHTDVSAVLQNIKNAKKRLQETSNTLKDRRDKHANKSWYNIISDTETPIRDAQYEMTAAMTELGKQSTELLLFNTAISKVICDMQGVLLQQQGVLDEQTQGLEKQNEAILANTEKLTALYAERTEDVGKQDAFAAQVTQVMAALDASQEDAHRRLIDCLTRFNTLAERLDASDSRSTDMATGIAALADEVQSSEARLMGRLDNSDALLVRRAQELGQEFESRCTALADVAVDRERAVVEQLRKETSSSIEAVTAQLAQLQSKARSQGRLVIGLTIGVCVSTLVALASLASLLLHA